MLGRDIKVMADRLNELAEALDKKPVGEKGLTVWFSVLREFPIERICAVFIGWPKSHAKFPAPAEVWKVCNDIGINERERKAATEARENREHFSPGVGGEQAEKFIAEMRRILKQPKWTPREHWQRVLDSQKSTEKGKEYAREALLKMGVLSREREPGEDDEAIAA